MVEFFASIVHHGREDTYNIVCAVMGFGKKRNSSKEVGMNLGGPGIEALR